MGPVYQLKSRHGPALVCVQEGGGVAIPLEGVRSTEAGGSGNWEGQGQASKALLDEILETAQRAPSSFNTQPYKVAPLRVKDVQVVLVRDAK